jgi:hypothetical protein
MQSKYVFLYVSVVLCLLLSTGCRDWEWTNFEFINLSSEELRVEVYGIQPHPSGTMAVGPDSLKSTRMGDPVTIDEEFRIVWTVNDGAAKKEKVFKRSDFKIPAKLSGASFKFKYTEKGEWELEFSN